MFLGETAKGDYPLECVRTMANICKEAEAAIWQNQIFRDLSSKALPPIDATHAVAIASVEASIKCLTTAIIVITTTGRSAHLIAKYRPRCPIIAVTRFHQVARQAHLFRGILPLYYDGTIFVTNIHEMLGLQLSLLKVSLYEKQILLLVSRFINHRHINAAIFIIIEAPLADWIKDVDVRVQYGLNFGKSRGFIKMGDSVVVVTGWRQGSGFTNTLRIVYVEQELIREESLDEVYSESDCYDYI